MPKMMHLNGFRLAVLLIAGLALMSWALRSREAPGIFADIEQMNTELEGLRKAVDSCTAVLTREEAAFQDYTAELDSLRASVRAYESDERTVPAEEYRRYLELFDKYGDEVANWDERADALRQDWKACRDLAKKHNVLADSLNAMIRGPDLPAP